MEICALRDNAVPPGNLATLISDCDGDEAQTPQILCDCCTDCRLG